MEVIKITLPTPFSVGPINIYVLKGNVITLIDTGPKNIDTWKLFIEQLKLNQLELKDIDQIILTHHHTDHIGLVEEIMQIKEMNLYSHPLAAPYLSRDPVFMKERIQFFHKLYQRHGVPDSYLYKLDEIDQYLQKFSSTFTVKNFLSEGDFIPHEESWEIIETPGHAPDHISLYNRKNYELIGGDHLIKHISSNAFVEPIYGDIEKPRSLLVYREALKKLLNYPINRVYAGHGVDIENAHQLILDRLAKQEERANNLYSFINEATTAFELSKKMFPRLYLKELPLTMSEIIGHLDLLVDAAQVDIHVGEDEVIFYTVKKGI